MYLNIRCVVPIVLLTLAVSSAFARGKLLQETTESYALDEGGSISLDNVNGDVSITAWEGNDVRVHYRIFGDSDQQLDQINVRINSDPSHLSIETHYRNSKSWWGNNNHARVEYELQAPATARLDGIETVNGDLRISGMRAAVDAETVNGDIEARDLRSDAKLDTVNGSIQAWFNRFEDDQRVSIESVNGRLDVYLPSNADVRIKAETIHGSLQNDFGIEVDKGFIGRDLNGKVGSGSARLSLDTVNGSISIHKN